MVLLPNARRHSPFQVGHFDGFQVAYRKHTTDEAVIADSFSRDCFFRDVPEYVPASSHVILDIGAHIGTFALLASRKVPQGKVFAVEACRDTARLCQANAFLNNAENLSVTHLALADRKGTCQLSYDAGTWGHSIVAQLSERGETVPTDTLENFMERNAITQCHFMKLNCEGAEFPILLSAPPEVLSRIGVMLVLFHSDLYKLNDEKVLLQHLHASGFSTAIRHNSGTRGWIVATRQS
jgi:FkbM family methyltransferase